jgi:hypothetical protein
LFPQNSRRLSIRGPRNAACAFGISVLLIGCANVAPRSSTQQGTLALSASSFNFSSVVVGKSSTQTLLITNSGTAPLTIESLTLKSQQFQITGPSVPRTVLPSQSVSYTISFVPTSSGSQSAWLQISTNIATNPVPVSLTGIAQSAYASLQVSPASINFGNLKLQSTGTQNVTLKNTGDINMTVSGVTIAGAGFGYSDLSPGFSLSPSQSVTFQVWFKPMTAGPASGTVTILSANIASPQEIPVSGDGLTSNPPPTTPTPTQHTVDLSWQPSSTANIVGYRVYRSAVSGTGYAPLTSAANILSYSDNTVANGATYYYVVTAVDSSGNESPHSNEVSAVIPAT